MTTQFFQIVSIHGLLVRTKPEISPANVIPDRMLAFKDILEVRSESRTQNANYVWWEHANTPGIWSASEEINPHITLMTPYQPPHIPTPPPPVTTPVPPTPTPQPAPPPVVTPAQPPVLFEVVAEKLDVRSAPKLGDTLVAGQNLLRGDRVLFRNPTTADGFIWWEQQDHPGYWSPAGSSQAGQTFMTPVDRNAEADGNTHMLTVPWVSQIQYPHNYANDCGHTCVLMVMRYRGLGWNNTVGDLYKLPFKMARGTTTNQQLPQIAQAITNNKLILKAFATRPATMDGLQALKKVILADTPIILLVYYLSLHFHNPANGPFSHWLVVTGFKGDTFYVNDPLWVTENQGAARPIDSKTLLKACQDTNNGLYGVY